VFLEDPAQVVESLSDGQGIGIPMLKSCGSHLPQLDIRVTGASGDESTTLQRRVPRCSYSLL
jgi:hypothetical protein